MRIHILSDLHLEFGNFDPPASDADVVVLAGDIHVGAAGISWAQQHFAGRQVIYVVGNHEFYGGRVIPEVIADLKAQAGKTDFIHVLDNEERLIDGVRFLGSTLWTDFHLFGEAQSAKARLEARAKMSDFRGQIRITPGSAFSPEASVVLHEQAVEWLTFKLRKEPFAGKTVVVTHHGHKQSMNPRYADDLLAASFLSDLEPLLGFSALWVHGHTHTAFNYAVKDTRVICNPRGYVGRDGWSLESTGFDPALVVSI